MPDGLYEQDALAWAEQQAALLRQLAAGERLNETLDWRHIIEEVEDVGLSELRAVKSSLRLGMMHLLKLHAWPASMSVEHWRREVGRFLDDAEGSFTESMRQRIDLAALYAKALRRASTSADDSGTARPLPDDCPFDLDALLAGDITALTQALARS